MTSYWWYLALFYTVIIPGSIALVSFIGLIIDLNRDYNKIKKAKIYKQHWENVEARIYQKLLAERIRS